MTYLEAIKIIEGPNVAFQHVRVLHPGPDTRKGISILHTKLIRSSSTHDLDAYCSSPVFGLLKKETAIN